MKNLNNVNPILKLRIYKLFKQQFGLEPYLENILDKDLRRSLSSFCLSTHRLRIGRGRYFREKKKKLRKDCDSCNMVENEVHFLCECSKYDTQRQKGIFIRIMTCSDRDIEAFMS